MIFTVDTIGQHGVQLFVDAGRPVDDSLVTALIREVLAEKIAAMLGEKLELDRLARRPQQTTAVMAATDSSSQPTRVTGLFLGYVPVEIVLHVFLMTA